ncbi:MFS transporter [Actinomyces capricornis]|uniref:MFS transporter n=1 Tax=Actinomyces capricornis TaxID=2755559 RepID=A0ABN6K8V3_9ACTO|nr:MFS transporter [Actinomyces capricornis]BDA64803.1 MFS transporter [Actinomyces capricornis]
MPLVALTIGGTATSSGMIGTLTRVACVAALVPGGVLADRVNRRGLIVRGHLLRAVVFTAVVLAWWLGALSMWVLCLAAVCSGAMSGVFGLASDAAVKNVVPEDQLPSAAAANQARSSAVELVSSPLAGLLLAVSPVLPFLAEVSGHVLGAACAAGIEADMEPGDEGEPVEQEPRSFIRDLRQACRLLASQPPLLALAAACSLGSAALTGFFLGLMLWWRLQEVPTAQIGLLLTAPSAAMLLGAALAPLIIDRLPAGAILIGFQAVHALVLLSCALTRVPLVQAALLACAGLILPVWNAEASARMMRLIPSGGMGRVLGLIQTLIMAPPILAPFLAGRGLDLLGGMPTLVLFAVVDLLAAGVLIGARGAWVRPRLEAGWAVGR